MLIIKYHLLFLNYIDFYVSVCRKDNKGHGDISHKGENGFTGQQTGLLDTTENIQMTTSEDLHANKQHEKCLNGNAKNIDH